MSSNARDTVRHTSFVRVKVWPQGVYRSDPSDLLIFWCTGFSTVKITAIVEGGGCFKLKENKFKLCVQPFSGWVDLLKVVLLISQSDPISKGLFSEV